jgi:hypothetical protein
MIFIQNIIKGKQVLRVYCISDHNVDLAMIKNYVDMHVENLNDINPTKYEAVEREFEIEGQVYLLRFVLLN